MHTSTTVVERYVEAIERGDGEAYGALFAADAVAHHPLYPEPVRGRDAICEGEQALFDAFSDIEVDVRTVLRSETQFALEVVLTAVNTGPLDLGGGTTLPATGRTIELPATWWLQLGDDGRIVETRDYLDTATLMSQLGVD